MMRRQVEMVEGKFHEYGQLFFKISTDEEFATALTNDAAAAMRSANIDIEEGVANEFSILTDGLEANGLTQERRALRLAIPDLEHKMIDAKTVVLKFSLPSGTYATTVLAELGDFK